MKKLTFAIISMVLLSACSSSDEGKIAQEIAQTNYNACQKDYYSASEIVKVVLTQDGKVQSMAVGNQNLVPCQMAQAPKSAMVATVEVFGTVANTALNVAASAVPYVAISKIAVDGITNAGGNTYNDGSFNSHSEANQANQQTTETVNGIKANGNVDQSQHNQNNPNTETTTNTDNNSVNNSNNSNDDNSTTESTAPVDIPVADDL